MKSENRGRRWESIAGNLPERHLLWRVVQDHVEPELLFLGSEFGVFFTVDGGDRWTKLAGNVPNIAFRDLAIQARENDLVGGTFGRGIYILDDYSPLRDVSADLLETESRLFPVRRTRWYVPKRPYACARPGCVDSQGDAFYVAPNPPFGAVFTYYLPEALQTSKAEREEAEKDLEAENENVRFPGWDRVLEEELEDEPAVVFAVTDSDGMTVRYVPGPVEAGFHRVAWDLRYPALDPWVPEAERESRWSRPTGVLATPGTYEVAMYRRVDGEWTDMGQSQAFEVVSIREPTLPGSSQDERLAFDRQVDELRRATEGSVKAIDAIVTELDAIKETLATANADRALYTEANGIQQALKRERTRLAGFETREELQRGRAGLRAGTPVPRPLRSGRERLRADGDAADVAQHRAGRVCRGVRPAAHARRRPLRQPEGRARSRRGAVDAGEESRRSAAAENSGTVTDSSTAKPCEGPREARRAACGKARDVSRAVILAAGGAVDGRCVGHGPRQHNGRDNHGTQVHGRLRPRSYACRQGTRSITISAIARSARASPDRTARTSSSSRTAISRSTRPTA
ncbi:MAG: hypothetical protein U5K76_15990 [Woeseiaceae bacterium]|nr:hypothetical protein [Woeseiaceae bacterium]